MTTATPPATRASVAALRPLYFSRFGFAVAWAIALAAASAVSSAGSPGLSPFALVLLLVYPLFDVAAAVVDRRVTGTAGPLLFVNMALSLLAAIGIALVAAVAGLGSAGLSGAVVVWGAWAITAGAVQLVVALVRRRSGGQWPMILSGGISVLAGAGFLAQAGGAPALTGLAGYATLGGVFFLLSAIRLGRAARR